MHPLCIHLYSTKEFWLNPVHKICWLHQKVQIPIMVPVMDAYWDQYIRVHTGSSHVTGPTYLPYGPGDKEQLMCQDATAKFVRSDILRQVQKTISFCTKLT
jgi:hypothetical protein